MYVETLASFWKSNPRHYCEICNAWMAADKASIAFHEGGKRHKEAVERRIRESRLRTDEKNREQRDLQAQLERIEEAAVRAMRRDIAANPALARDQSYLASMRPAARPPTSEPLPPSGISTASVMDAVQKRMAEVHKATAPVPVDGHPSWVQCTSPEGYPFFFNTDTGESSWEHPDKMPAAVEDDEAKPETSEKSETAAETAADDKQAAAKTDAEKIAEAAAKAKPIERRPADVGMVGGWSRVSVAAPAASAPAAAAAAPSSSSSPSSAKSAAATAAATANKLTEAQKAEAKRSALEKQEARKAETIAEKLDDDDANDGDNLFASLKVVVEDKLEFKQREMPSLKRRADDDQPVAFAKKKKKQRGNIRKREPDKAE